MDVHNDFIMYHPTYHHTVPSFSLPHFEVLSFCLDSSCVLRPLPSLLSRMMHQILFFLSFFLYSFDDTGLRTFLGYGHRYLEFVLHLQLGNPTR